MRGNSAKNKVIVISLIWLIVSGVMFGYFFKILDDANLTALTKISKDKQQLVILQAQNTSYIQAQADLKAMASKPIQPDDFFSRDITLVNEIKTLEGLSQKLNVQMQFSGVSGTVDIVPKANTATALGVVPYSLSVTGDLQSVVNFIETMENLSFVSNITSLALNSGDQGKVSASLSANFYLRK